jgi:hypothetical protein
MSRKNGIHGLHGAERLARADHRLREYGVREVGEQTRASGLGRMACDRWKSANLRLDVGIFERG